MRNKAPNIFNDFTPDQIESFENYYEGVSDEIDKRSAAWGYLMATVSSDQPNHDKVNIPVHESEAAMMVLLGTEWLEKNAPARLRKNTEQPVELSEVIKRLERRSKLAFSEDQRNNDDFQAGLAWGIKEAIAEICELPAKSISASRCAEALQGVSITRGWVQVAEIILHSAGVQYVD